jgi:predicted acetylornithine/succinylornithine family transaminase
MENLNTNNKVFEKGNQFLMNTYSRQNVVFVKAKMQYLWDIEGKKYIDFTSGYGCLNVGHTNNYVVKALKRQVEKIIQPSNVFYNLPQVELAELLCKITGFGQKVFFANSGAEAIEGSIKLARKYSTDKYNKERYEIISFYNSFHGRTFGALSATAQFQKQNIFEPLLMGFRYAEFNNMDSVNNIINKNTCAILVEPIQGEGGINVADNSFLKDLRKLCSDNDILFILDEVQTGFGRTGELFAFQNYNVVPDILVLAKSLGGGMPIGAIVSTDEISSAFTPGTHGSTFGGNAASCAAGVSVVNYLLTNNLPGNAKKLGDYLFKKLFKLKNKYKIIKEVRGMGLMVGVEFTKPIASDLVNSGLKNGIVLNKISDFTIRLLPPLVITKKNINYFINFLDNYLKEFKDDSQEN